MFDGQSIPFVTRGNQQQELPTSQPASSFRFLQIGANDFHTGANDDFQDWLRKEAKHMQGIEAALVEPNPTVYKVLKENTKHAFGDERSTHIKLLTAQSVQPVLGKSNFG